ncbi:DUF2779 domain-containing protein [Mycoplasmoides pirum]|uniref:DUF2779 domain-containing protein n=1 Tax=Mycoplasmoides pirum TaxID=2122 RepID=UPI000488EC13|nr:DUF2779 domain-containing protein [Mycoplasmoides pirum]
MSFKKLNFVSKNDFVNYFNRPSSFWYLNNDEIEGIFNSYNKNNKGKSITFDVEQDLDEYIEFDPLDIYLNSNDIKLSSNSNPKIIEGKIIYEKLINFLINFSKQSLNIFNVVDFDEMFPTEKFTLENKYKKIKDFIDKVKEPTLFLNPVFIYNNAIAKPIAIVSFKKDYEIFFAKSSTGTKRSDLLNFYFQIEITKHNIPLKNASLFLFAKERKPKGHISFSVTNLVSLTKSSKRYDKSDDKKLNSNFSNKNFIEINNLIKGKKFLDFEMLLNVDKLNKISLKYVDFLKEYKNIVDNFWEIINEINSTNISNNLAVPFTSKFDSYWDKFSYQKQVRQVWGLDNEIFLYSGKVISFEKAFQFVNKYKNNSQISLNFFLNLKFLPLLINFYKFFLNEFKENNLNFFNFDLWRNKTKDSIFEIDYTYVDTNSLSKENYFNWTKKEALWFQILNYPFNSYENLQYLLNDLIDFPHLKQKKIYFDFETINPSIRAIDNSFPYAQIITQCSIIKNDNTNKFECQNLIVDPRDINLSFFKKVVDSLYVDNAFEYDYIVYNASFEKSRLLELKDYLQDEEYNKKIDAIVANLYDLANWFNINNQVWHIWLKDLYGYYSIKNVLELIPQKILDETKTKSYKSLNVQRGDRAQALTSLRYFEAISDKEWKKLSEDLCQYCENDVRAMIAVEKFGLNLIDKFSKKDLPENLEIFLIVSNTDDNKVLLLKSFLEKLSKKTKKELNTLIELLTNELKNMELTLKNQYLLKK